MNHPELIIKRNGQKVPFKSELIYNAIRKAFLSENINSPEQTSDLTQKVIHNLCQVLQDKEVPQVEQVQDIVEEILMTNGHHKVARNYILYREQHKQVRQERILTQIKDHKLEVKVNDHDTVIFDPKIIEERLRRIGNDLLRVSISEMVDTVTNQIYDKITKNEIDLLVLGAARERIEKHYEYAALASRIVVNNLYKQVLKKPMNTEGLEDAYQSQFDAYIKTGISLEMLNPELANYDMAKLAKALQPERDKLFLYMGSQILMDRYLLRDRTTEKNIYELPQWFWMRVAMGLALNEPEKEKRAIEFYDVLSKMDLVSSTPTLFNSGTTHSQMSSCYLNLAEDSLDGIFKLYADNAQLSKWAGGIGTDWTHVRATGSPIKGTNGQSQGVIPFIKIFNDVALAVNQGGKRKGAMCAYMEVWHRDFEQFIELKKNTGDERRRAHDVNTAAWIPDLFMKRIQENGNWTFFCPSDVPELHDLYGKAFEKKYVEYENKNLERAKTVKALDLWRRMLTMLYETGHPWITFKDAANVRNPQDHTGVIHSSNLCTEITLNTSPEETAVCNLASLNLANMFVDGQLNEAKIEKTVTVGIRMLDNVIDNNYYPTKEAERANLRHRAIGLGLMGYQDALFQLNLTFDCNDALEFADKSMEMISYYAIKGSARLAKERGAYSTYKGSKWDRGIFPIDSMDLLEDERGVKIETPRTTRMDWDTLKAFVNQHGMRNSNCMAIAPTATISNISGVYPCTEPVYKNIYMKENLSGNFIVVNRYLVDDLDRLGLWNQKVINKIKIDNGSVQNISEIPDHIKGKYKEVFEINSRWIIKAAALRCKWIDQSASTNVFLDTKSGKDLNDAYMLAWKDGLKTTYYLRTLGASQIQKATVDDTNAAEPATSETPEEQPKVISAQPKVVKTQPQTVNVAAYIDDPDCEACQ